MVGITYELLCPEIGEYLHLGKWLPNFGKLQGLLGPLRKSDDEDDEPWPDAARAIERFVYFNLGRGHSLRLLADCELPAEVWSEQIGIEICESRDKYYLGAFTPFKPRESTEKIK